jgi:hypothetical protein
MSENWIRNDEAPCRSRKFRAQGFTARFTVKKQQTHRVDTLAGDGAARLFNQCEEARQVCGGK